MLEIDSKSEIASHVADKLAQNLKAQQDVSDMTKMLAKVAMERILELEVEEYLGEKKAGQRPSSISRNGCTQKKIKTENAEIDLEIPRDRDASLETQLIKKNQH